MLQGMTGDKLTRKMTSTEAIAKSCLLREQAEAANSLDEAKAFVKEAQRLRDLAIDLGDVEQGIPEGTFRSKHKLPDIPLPEKFQG